VKLFWLARLACAVGWGMGPRSGAQADSRPNARNGNAKLVRVENFVILYRTVRK
jgi:hypothetical protein